MKWIKDKKIILAMPKDYSLSILIAKNLESLGLQVVNITPQDTVEEEFRYESLKQRLLNLYYKTIHKNKNYKKKLKKEFYLKNKYNKINTFKEYDFCLFIRADFFDNDIIQYCKSKSKKIVSFHYDGINRNKKIFNKIPFFDTFFVFDKEDLKVNPNFKYISNFYFDYPEEYKDKDIQHDFYFLGSHHESRKDSMFKLYEKLCELSEKVKFEIVFDKADFNEIRNYEEKDIHCFKKIVAYQLYLENIKKTKTIIDLVISEHKGLSFRVFESLKYNKKLITTNKTIKDYPFYNENNILVLDNNNLDEIDLFLEKPFIKISPAIIETYSFTNWFKNLYNLEQHIKIK